MKSSRRAGFDRADKKYIFIYWQKVEVGAQKQSSWKEVAIRLSDCHYWRRHVEKYSLVVVTDI